MADWQIDDWLSNVIIPLLVFLATYIVGLWVRRYVYKTLNQWADKGGWEGSQLVIQTTRTSFLHWFLILGAFIALHISPASITVKAVADKALASLFVLSLIWVTAIISEKLLKLYTSKTERLQQSTRLIVNINKIIIVVVGVLILLDIWGAPTTPIILLVAIGSLVAAFASRDAIANFFSGIQLSRGTQIEVGDFIRLESGEEGQVIDITWRNTQIRTLNGNLILCPNSRLVQCTVTNYGRPLRKATTAFRFYSRLHLKEVTGLKARNLTEMAYVLKKVPGSVIYHHTHNFLEEHQYLTPEPANDFALWISDDLGNEILGEKLASIDTFDFPTIASLRARIIGVIEDYLSCNSDDRNAPEGRDFHFIKSISVIVPTSYVAHDLREFTEILRKVSINSISYHMFEARLRLQKGVNDFSAWIDECLGDKDLADKLAYLDPYNYTLEGLRSTMIQLIEKRIK